MSEEQKIIEEERKKKIRLLKTLESNMDKALVSLRDLIKEMEKPEIDEAKLVVALTLFVFNYMDADTIFEEATAGEDE